jgi:hypothetical protein
MLIGDQHLRRVSWKLSQNQERHGGIAVIARIRPAVRIGKQFRDSFSGIHRANVFGREWQERKMPRAFDRQRQLALMARAGADLAAGANLAAIGQVAAELFGIFIVNEFVFVFAVDADAPHGRTKPALLPVTSAVATTAIAARTARTSRAAS